MLYDDPATGRRLRTRLTPEIARVPFELCRPIRNFPAYRGRRSHQGKYWFSRSQRHVGFESRFEMTALMMLDFRGDAIAVSSNPFWLLWPKGVAPMRHAPDFFIRRCDGSAQVIDVKPADRLKDKDRLQHDRTREVCNELGWEYEEFTSIDATIERNLRLLCGYHHQRFEPPAEARTAIVRCLQKSGNGGTRLGDLIDAASSECIHLGEDRLICGIYHLVWSGAMHADLTRPLSWNTVIAA
ncbi:TnsA-like heteromeric transposase endonuclease subunit [Mycolicibacterium sarraceniae]|uniref:TnsA-like heteromeric transposase endonuclease subunit n=1 Tax=Mycolicibacterium sarraceniae TaxID=1534348 RepID=UPI0013D56D08|nr:TnsA-like heteromeric transposase endonuclease subunit [Mycolicibacterium sarraceniae]